MKGENAWGWIEVVDKGERIKKKRKKRGERRRNLRGNFIISKRYPIE